MDRVAEKNCIELVALWKKSRRLDDLQLSFFVARLHAPTVRDILNHEAYIDEKLADKTAAPKNATNAKPDEKFSWHTFYNMIRKDVKRQLKKADQKLLVFSNVEELGDVQDITVLKDRAAVFAQLTSGTNNLSINNHVEAGLFLRTAKTFWTSHGEAWGVSTWTAFLDAIEIKWSPDWVRKLMAVAETALLYPKVRLITCIGIGEFVRHAQDFLSYLNLPEHEGDRSFWRQQKNQMEWTFDLNYVTMKNGKTSKVGSMVATGLAETMQEFDQRRGQVVKRLREADDAVRQENAQLEQQNAQESAPAMEAVQAAVAMEFVQTAVDKASGSKAKARKTTDVASSA